MRTALNLTLALLCVALLPTDVLAQGQISETANRVSNGLFSFGTYDMLAVFLRNRVLIILDIVVLFFLVRAGLKLINSQDEGKLSSAKNTIASALVGLMLAHLSGPLVDAFITSGGASTEGTATLGARILAIEIDGLIDWVLTLVAVLGILMIVLSGIRALASLGKDDATTQLRQTVFGTVTGIFFLIISGAVKLTLGLRPGTDPVLPGNPSAFPIIERSVEIVTYLLTFLALVAFVVVAYAGFRMILNTGDETQFQESRSLLGRAIIGLVVILFANILALFVLQIF